MDLAWDYGIQVSGSRVRFLPRLLHTRIGCSTIIVPTMIKVQLITEKIY